MGFCPVLSIGDVLFFFASGLIKLPSPNTAMGRATLYHPPSPLFPRGKALRANSFETRRGLHSVLVRLV